MQFSVPDPSKTQQSLTKYRKARQGKARQGKIQYDTLERDRRDRNYKVPLNTPHGLSNLSVRLDLLEEEE